MPKLVVGWQLTPQEREAWDRLLSGLVDACAKAGLGRLELGSIRWSSSA
jgi:hypothetical protein